MKNWRVTGVAVAATLIACLGVSLQAEPLAKSKSTTSRAVRSKIQYVRYIAGPDAAAAGRAFDAQWKAIFFSTPSPNYPFAARLQKITGTVLIRISVDELGKVTAVRILQSAGNAHLDAEALRALRLWRARPGPRREVDMPVTFVLDGVSGAKPFHARGRNQ